MLPWHAPRWGLPKPWLLFSTSTGFPDATRCLMRDVNPLAWSSPHCRPGPGNDAARVSASVPTLRTAFARATCNVQRATCNVQRASCNASATIPTVARWHGGHAANARRCARRQTKNTHVVDLDAVEAGVEHLVDVADKRALRPLCTRHAAAGGHGRRGRVSACEQENEGGGRGHVSAGVREEGSATRLCTRSRTQEGERCVCERERERGCATARNVGVAAICSNIHPPGS